MCAVGLGSFRYLNILGTQRESPGHARERTGGQRGLDKATAGELGTGLSQSCFPMLKRAGQEHKEGGKSPEATCPAD